jgi:hypothetical protein
MRRRRALKVGGCWLLASTRLRRRTSTATHIAATTTAPSCEGSLCLSRGCSGQTTACKHCQNEDQPSAVRPKSKHTTVALFLGLPSSAIQPARLINKPSRLTLLNLNRREKPGACMSTYYHAAARVALLPRYLQRHLAVASGG